MTKTVRLDEEHYNRLQKEANDCRLALAQFMAAYGNCDVPGALMNLAHKPEVPPGMDRVSAHEAAMFAAFKRGAKVLGITINLKRASRAEAERPHADADAGGEGRM